MWTITGFFPIEEKVYQDNIIIGRPDYEKGNHMLKELFQ
jgi:hypothetical protein